jgi:DNA repair protein RadC
VTRALREAGELLGLPLLDHLIVTDAEHYSFREQGGWDR